MFGISRCVDNFVRLRRLSSAGYFPFPKNWYKVLKKQTNKKANNLYWQDTQRMVRASYMAMAICFQRGMVNNVGILFF